MNLLSNVSINRKQYPWGRAYIVEEEGKDPLILPSVTTILKLVKIEKYEKMRDEIGEEKMVKIMNDAAERGNVMHRMLELFILEWDREKNVERALKKAQIYAIEESRKDGGKNSKIVDKGRNLFWNFYHDKFWENIYNVVDNEIFLFTTFRGGWAGASDFVYRDINKDLIVDDFKSATFAKDEEEILSYKLQISAYMFMCSEKYREIPKFGRIRISNENSNDLQTFTVHDYEMKEYMRIFIDLLDKFRKINNL